MDHFRLAYYMCERPVSQSGQKIGFYLNLDHFSLYHSSALEPCSCFPPPVSAYTGQERDNRKERGPMFINNRFFTMLLSAALLFGCGASEDLAPDPSPNAGAGGATSTSTAATGTGGVGGNAPDCPPPCFLWAQGFDGPDSQTTRDLALGPSEEIILAGDMRGSLDFGSGPLDAGDGRIPFLASFSANGDSRWSKLWQGDAELYSQSSQVTVSNAGEIIIAVSHYGSIDLGGGLLEHVGGNQALTLASFDAAGNHRWSKIFGAAHVPYVSLAVDPEGNVLVGGLFSESSGPLDFGGGPLAYVDSYDIFLASLDRDGHHRWSRSFGSPEGEDIYSLALAKDGSIVVAGVLETTLDFGGGNVIDANEEIEAYEAKDIFLARFDESGTCLWAKSFGDEDDQAPGPLMLTEESIVLSMNFWGTIDTGGGVFTNSNSGGNSSVIVTFTYDGEHVLSRIFQTSPGSNGFGVIAATAVGEDLVLNVGSFGSVDFGDGIFEEIGESRLAFARLNANLEPIWHSSFDLAWTPRMLTTPEGVVVMTGTYHFPATLGDVALPHTDPMQDANIFLTTFVP